MGEAIKITLKWPAEDGTITQKEVPIGMSKAVGDSEGVFKINFKLTIPDLLHSALKGKSVPALGQHRRGPGELASYAEDWPKTLNSNSLEGLTERWRWIVRDYEWLKQIENAKLTKVIFFNFFTLSKDWSSFYNSRELGTMNEFKFRQCTGYISETVRVFGDKTIRTDHRYNHNKLHVNPQDKEFYALSFVEWTEERQMFFDTLQVSFESLIAGVDQFVANLNEDNINKLIASGNRLLNAGPVK